RPRDLSKSSYPDRDGIHRVASFGAFTPGIHILRACLSLSEPQDHAAATSRLPRLPARVLPPSCPPPMPSTVLGPANLPVFVRVCPVAGPSFLHICPRLSRSRAGPAASRNGRKTDTKLGRRASIRRLTARGRKADNLSGFVRVWPVASNIALPCSRAQC